MPADGEEAHAANQRFVSGIRRNGAQSSCPSSRISLSMARYSMDEVDAVLDSFKAGRHCLQGCYAALRSPCRPARLLVAALVNLSRHMCLTSSLWSIRRFSLIRKSGPPVVRNSMHLRPISISSDMAQVQDALWLSRVSVLIDEYCGPAQVGGVSDPISLVIALVLLCQLRDHQGLPTYLALTDLQWAFDTASIDGMLFHILVPAATKGS